MGVEAISLKLQQNQIQSIQKTSTHKGVSKSYFISRRCSSHIKSAIQKTVTLLVTEAEVFAEVKAVQDMMFINHVVTSLRLKEE